MIPGCPLKIPNVFNYAEKRKYLGQPIEPGGEFADNYDPVGGVWSIGEISQPPYPKDYRTEVSSDPNNI